MKFLRFQKLKWLVIILLIVALTDRLYWVNGGGGLSGWRNVSDVPIEYSACSGHSVEYKIEVNIVRYRCSLIGGDIPIWPFYGSGSVKHQ